MTPDMQPWGGFPWGYYPWGGLQQADYLADYRDFLPWEAQDTGEQNISVRCGTPKPASAIGISGHNLKTAGVLISVEGSNDNFLSDVHTILAASTPFSNRPLLLTFTQTQYPDLRLHLTAGGVPAKIGEICLGIPIVMPAPPDTPFIPGEEGIAVDVNESQIGQLLGAIIRFYPVSTDIVFTVLERSWALSGWGQFTWGEKAWGDGASVRAIWEYLKTLRPLFFAWDLDTYPADALYAHADPSMTWKTPFTTLPYLDSVEVKLQSLGG